MLKCSQNNTQLFRIRFSAVRSGETNKACKFFKTYKTAYIDYHTRFISAAIVAELHNRLNENRHSVCVANGNEKCMTLPSIWEFSLPNGDNLLNPATRVSEAISAIFSGTQVYFTAVGFFYLSQDLQLRPGKIYKQFFWQTSHFNPSLYARICQLCCLFLSFHLLIFLTREIMKLK